MWKQLSLSLEILLQAFKLNRYYVEVGGMRKQLSLSLEILLQAFKLNRPRTIE
jgi:hypothetical protein